MADEWLIDGELTVDYWLIYKCGHKVAKKGRKPLFAREAILRPRLEDPFLFWEAPLQQGRKGTLPNNGGPYSYVLTVWRWLSKSALCKTA